MSPPPQCPLCGWTGSFEQSDAWGPTLAHLGGYVAAYSQVSGLSTKSSMDETALHRPEINRRAARDDGHSSGNGLPGYTLCRDTVGRFIFRNCSRTIGRQPTTLRPLAGPAPPGLSQTDGWSARMRLQGAPAHPAHDRVAVDVLPDRPRRLLEGPRLAALPVGVAVPNRLALFTES